MTRTPTRRGPATCGLLLAASAWACTDGPGRVDVHVRTDLVAFEEFDAVRVDVDGVPVVRVAAPLTCVDPITGGEVAG